MVTLNKIYTRGGDQGKTSLADGKRYVKYTPVITTIGEVDETNAQFGIIRTLLLQQTDEESQQQAAEVDHIQHDLFDLGADLARPATDTSSTASNAEKTPAKPSPLRMTETQVNWLENTIDHYNSVLAPLTSFILPGGELVAAHWHLARTITRRAERQTALLSAQQPHINKHVLIYLNRLSDLCFVMSRYRNNKGTSDVLWQPGKNQ